MMVLFPSNCVWFITEKDSPAIYWITLIHFYNQKLEIFLSTPILSASVCTVHVGSNMRHNLFSLKAIPYCS